MDALSVLPGWWEVYDTEDNLSGYIGFAPEGKFELKKPEILTGFRQLLRDLDLTERSITKGIWCIDNGRLLMQLEEDTDLIPKPLRLAVTSLFPIHGRILNAHAKVSFRESKFTMQYPITIIGKDEFHTSLGDGRFQVWRRRTAPIL